MFRLVSRSIAPVVLLFGLFVLFANDVVADAAKDVAAARRVFESNLDSIRRKDRDAYLATYLDATTLARTGFEGPRLGYAEHAAGAGQGWPDVFEARDLRLVPVRPGVVYGTYRYRVAYGQDEHRGISERIFLETKSGWRIAMTSAFDAPLRTPAPPVALVGATLVDGTGAPPVPDAVVVVRNGRIACAGPRAQCAVPESVEVVDVRGLWLTPGIVDAHVHFSQTAWADGRPDALDLRARYPYEDVQADLRANPERRFRSFLGSGVTAVFDVGGYPWTWDMRDRFRTDSRAPYIAASGPLLSTMDHWLNLPAERQFIYLADEAAAQNGVRYLASQHTDAVKVWFIPVAARDFESMAKIVTTAGEEAKKVELPLIVHATGLREAKAALRAGAHLLVHSVEDQPIDDEFLQLARTNRSVYCPTLTVRGGYARMYESAATGNPPVIDDPLGCVDSLTLARIASTPEAGKGIVDAERARNVANRIATQAPISAANLKRVQEAGIPIAMGTDAGNPLTLHGPSVFAEMEAMQAAGLTPPQVLVASTRGGALAMRREAEFGTIEPGKTADLVLVAADPTQDIAHMRQLRWVMRAGVLRGAKEMQAVAKR